MVRSWAQHLSSSQVERRHPQVASVLVCALFIVCFHTGLLSYLEPALAEGGLTWKVAYYGFWLFALTMLVVAFMTVETVWKATSPFVMLSGSLIALAFLHPHGPVTNSFVVAFGMFLTVVGLAVSADASKVARLLATTTTLGALACLVEINFTDGLTGTPGRAAGFYGNPNVAAAALVLGASASWRSIGPRWRLAFLLFVAAAVIVTLSRSSLLISASAAVACCVYAIFFPRRGALGGVRLGEGWQRGLLACVIAVALVASAMVNNERLGWAVGDSIEGVRTLFATLEDANASMETTDSIVEDLGKINSGSARIILFQRSLAAFLERPMFGHGLETAHALSPHNTYLLFAVAFGVPGLLGIVALLSISAYYAFNARMPELVFVTAGLMMASHDILLVPALLVPFSVGVALLLTQCAPTNVGRHDKLPPC